MMTGGWGRCIQMLLKGLLDHAVKCNTCLIWGREMVPFLKWPDVEFSGEEETDGVGDELPIAIWIVLNSAEKDFRGVPGQVGAAENSLVCFKDGRSRLAIDDA